MHATPFVICSRFAETHFTNYQALVISLPALGNRPTLLHTLLIFSCAQAKKARSRAFINLRKLSIRILLHLCAGNIEQTAVSLNYEFAVLEALYRNNGSASSLHVLHSGDVREVSLGVYDGDSLAFVKD